MGAIIRKYRESDKERLRYICKMTADSSIWNNENRLEAITLIYNDYYTEYEPENIFVAADDNDEAVGYVICSANHALYKKILKTKIKKAINKTSKSELIVIYMILAAFSVLKKEHKTHLHIDLLPEYQRMGLGTKLLNALSDHLYKNGENYMTVCGIRKKSDGYKFYTKFGFKTIRRYAGVGISMAYKTKPNERN